MPRPSVNTPLSGDGSFVLENVGLGRQEVTAMIMPVGRKRSQSVELTEDQRAVEVELDFTAATPSRVRYAEVIRELPA